MEFLQPCLVHGFALESSAGWDAWHESLHDLNRLPVRLSLRLIPQPPVRVGSRASLVGEVSNLGMPVSEQDG